MYNIKRAAPTGAARFMYSILYSNFYSVLPYSFFFRSASFMMPCR